MLGVAQAKGGSVIGSRRSLDEIMFYSNFQYGISGLASRPLLAKEHNWFEGFSMKFPPRHILIVVLFTILVWIPLILSTPQESSAANETQANEEGLPLRRLLVAGCLAGLAVVVMLVITQIRGTWKKRGESDGSSAHRKAGSVRTQAFRCRNCGRVFREKLTAEGTLQCPLCGHLWRWPPPIEMRRLKGRMRAFAIDPKNPRGDITPAVRMISRLSKRVAEGILTAGKYLEKGEVLCVCDNCHEIHIVQRRQRGLLGVCAKCKSVLVVS